MGSHCGRRAYNITICLMRLPMSDDLTSAVGRDIMCTWTELRAQLIVGLSSGLSGVPYWTSGIHRYHACQLPFRNFTPCTITLVVAALTPSRCRCGGLRWNAHA